MTVPLIIATVWIQIWYGRTYKPLMKFIALSAVKRGEQYTDLDPTSSPEPESVTSSTAALEQNVWADSTTPQNGLSQARRRQNWRENGDIRERNLPFINPSLVAPLGKIWIADGIHRAGSEALLPTETEDGESNV
jgi:hypothetical protein